MNDNEVSDKFLIRASCMSGIRSRKKHPICTYMFKFNALSKKNILENRQIFLNKISIKISCGINKKITK